MMKKKEKEKEKRSKKWAGPAHQAAHVPLPLLAWLPNGNPLQRCSSFSTTRPPPLVSPPLHFPLRLRFRPRILPSPDALQCSPPSLLPFQIYSRRRPLPDRAAGGEEKAESSRRRRGDSATERNRRGDGGIERTSIRIDEEMAESRGHQHAHA